MNIYINVFIALILSLIFNYIYVLRFSRVKQTERIEGLELHKIKNGTITMGGIVFASICVILFLFLNTSFLNSIFLIFVPICFFIIGFIDDYLIVVKKSNEGINANIKLLIEIIISAVAFYIYLRLGLKTNISFFDYSINLKWLYGIFMLFMLVGGSNATNLTDGIDGLCGGVTIIVLLGFLYISIAENNLDVTLYIVLLIGALLGFLYFNLPTARLFMGDTGSLFLGASLVSIAILLKQELLLIVFGGVFVFETISVILQVISFKFFKQKRLFKMAPYHHHLEISGLSEIQIIFIMYFISIVLLIVGISLYNGGI